MGQIIQHSLHKRSIDFLFLKQKGLFPLVWFVGGNHTDVAVISQEHPTWGGKQLYLDWRNPMEKGNLISGGLLLIRLVLTLSWKQLWADRKCSESHRGVGGGERAWVTWYSQERIVSHLAPPFNSGLVRMTHFKSFRWTLRRQAAIV